MSPDGWPVESVRSDIGSIPVASSVQKIRQPGKLPANNKSTASTEDSRRSDRRWPLGRFVRYITRRHKDQGGVTEVRIIADHPVKTVWTGYFDADHISPLVDQIEPLEDSPRAKVPYGQHPR